MNAFVERIYGKFAIISVSSGQRQLAFPPKTFIVEDKKYIILLRKILPQAAREGLTIDVNLGKDGIERASGDLDEAIRQARLMNEIMDYTGKFSH